MSTTSIGSGLGAFAAIAAQPTYGATFVTPTRSLTFKTAKMTWDPHPVQGGPYLRNGQGYDLGSARVLTWLDAKGTIDGDVTNTGHALLLATALGSNAALTQISSTTAYQLGGTSGANISFPDLQNGGTSGCSFDMQLGVPDSSATLHAQNYHSCMITKATWVFDRAGLVTYSYDLDAQYLETSTSLITPSFPASPVPFSMGSASAAFAVGAYGAEAATDGIRKVTITLERKLKTDRAYLGNQYKDVPVSNDNVKVTAEIEADYTAAAKTGLFDLFLPGTATSIVCTAVGNAIGVSGKNDTFGIHLANAFVDSGGEANPDGPDLVKNTIKVSATLDTASDALLNATLITADTGF